MIPPNTQIGLFGVLDITDIIAISISYQLTLSDPNNPIDNSPSGLTPILIFVVVICSVIGLILIVLSLYLLLKKVSSGRKTLIRMNNEL
jgi:hypothetical protein